MRRGIGNVVVSFNVAEYAARICQRRVGLMNRTRRRKEEARRIYAVLDNEVFYPLDRRKDGNAPAWRFSGTWPAHWFFAKGGTWSRG